MDDIPDHVSIYTTALSRHGYRVHVEGTGCDALAAARQARPACAVIDVRLPDMSGWELCRDLKRDEATRETPVMVLTPDTSRAYARESARGHCNAWIAQPSRAGDLVRAVDRVLSQEEAAPRTVDDAVLGVSTCPACASDRVRATLRVGPIQYYACQACGHPWRIDAV